MSKLQALIFDVDGTLVDTEELHRQSFNQAFLEFGLGWDWSPARYAELLTVSGGADRMAHHVDLVDLPAGEKTRLRRMLPAVHREKTRIYGELIESNAVRLRPGAARLVAEAAGAGIAVGLVATSSSTNVQGLVATVFGRAAQSGIKAVVCADQVARRKPAPDLYDAVLGMLRVPRAGAVAFEDSANGLKAAKAAGLFTIVTPSRWTAGHAFEEADLLLPGLGEPDAPLEAAASQRLGGAPCLTVAGIETLRGGNPAVVTPLRQTGT